MTMYLHRSGYYVRKKKKVQANVATSLSVRLFQSLRIHRVDAPIMSRHVLWVIHINKCVEVYNYWVNVPCEICHLINRIPTYHNFV